MIRLMYLFESNGVRLKSCWYSSSVHQLGLTSLSFCIDLYYQSSFNHFNQIRSSINLGLDLRSRRVRAYPNSIACKAACRGVVTCDTYQVRTLKRFIFHLSIIYSPSTSFVCLTPLLLFPPFLALCCRKTP